MAQTGRHNRPTRLSLGIATYLCWVAISVAANALASTPDLEWAPAPWKYDRGTSVRYIDFEHGDDSHPGTRERPWKHHPWDAAATGRAAACRGVHTYCFRKGVIYRGLLVARDSGTRDEPIRLTVDPSWGKGEAALYGSIRVGGPWRRCTEASAPDIPSQSRTNVWYADTDGPFEPRLLCEINGGRMRRIPIARWPNWRAIDADDPRTQWWELTGRVVEVDIYVGDTRGFRVGDPVTGTGRWDDFDENRDNISTSRNVVTEVADDHIRIDSRAWKKGEIRRGATITNGRVTVKVQRVSTSWQNFGRLIDREHLKTLDGDSLDGATMWVEGANMPTPLPRKVLAYHPGEGSVRVWTGSASSGPDKYCRYFLEGLPQWLDEPGEWCFVRRGRQSGRIYLRLPEDRDPNHSIIEAAQLPILIDIRNRSHIEISGLAIRFSNPIDPKWVSRPPLSRPRAAAIHIEGDCTGIDVHHCRIAHVGYAITGLPEKDGDVLDDIRITDNDIHDVDGSGIYFSANHHWLLVKQAVTRLVHFSVLRNRLRHIGSRVIEPKAKGRDTIVLYQVEQAEVAGNIVDRSWGAGIYLFGGSDYEHVPVDRPLIRNLIHHNKVTNSLLSLQDFGGIASWQIGPCYVYNNISGNAVGYKHVHWRRFQEGEWKLSPTRAANWHRRSCYGIGLYLDGQYKGYAFNNIIWGKNNDVNDRLYNSCAFNEAQGFLNTVFNNTMARCGVGLHKGMLQHNRCLYLGNLMLDIGNYFIRQEPQDEFLEYDSLAFADNVFHGTPYRFGRIGRRDVPENTFETLEDWRRVVTQRGAMVSDAGVRADSPQTADAQRLDFRLRTSSVAVDRGVKVFVPWALYSVVGEWGFFKHRSDPSVILGENVNVTSEWHSRSMFHYIPRNNLSGIGIDASNFKTGTLEDWIEGALELNGKDEYCVLRDAELRSDYRWRDEREGRGGTFRGEDRVTVDMDTNNFLIEIVFKTKAGAPGGGLVSKCDDTGYVLDISEPGRLQMRLVAGGRQALRSSDMKVNDGRWHHVIAEVDRRAPQGIHIYIDGELHDGTWTGAVDAGESLSNRADFVVGKGVAGRGTGPARDLYFAGLIDFLRVARGTLADAETTIEQLYRWEFDGPFLKDFVGRRPTGARRDAGAIELGAVPAAPSK